MTIDNYFLTSKIETDELGRIVITDKALLEKINGGVMAVPEFMPPDVACGNGNCAC